jgi:probable rRNA maturation factor
MRRTGVRDISRGFPRSWRIHVSSRPRRLTIPRRWPTLLVREILALLDCEIPSPVSEISVVFTDDRVIRGLNGTYRKKDMATDVLSFPQAAGPGEDRSLGDLVISVETAKRQAKEFGVTFRDEMARLTIHGILHLCGYDHENVPRREADRMRRKERRLLSMLAPTAGMKRA